ncbi:MAG: hypothetical protein KME31_23605 [Tolypothrix carrinoi HA7290-LM1]|nr:hypothetical protein [Tolypothrix carrinoi HA7290-LM1]
MGRRGQGRQGRQGGQGRQVGVGFPHPMPHAQCPTLPHAQCPTLPHARLCPMPDFAPCPMPYSLISGDYTRKYNLHGTKKSLFCCEKQRCS